jgi:hypothetical protein
LLNARRHALDIGSVGIRPLGRDENQSRNARTGSVRVARQAGKKHAANEAIIITTNADPNVSGSRGLTL